MKLPTKTSGATGDSVRHGSDDTARRPPSVKAALSVSFGQRAPHRASTRDSSPVRRALPPSSYDKASNGDVRKSPSSWRSQSRERDSDRDRDRERGLDRNRDRDLEKDRDRDSDKDRLGKERDHNRGRYRDRDEDRDRERGRERRYDYDRRSSRRDYDGDRLYRDGDSRRSVDRNRSRSRTRSRSRSVVAGSSHYNSHSSPQRE